MVIIILLWSVQMGLKLLEKASKPTGAPQKQFFVADCTCSLCPPLSSIDIFLSIVVTKGQ